MGRRASFVMVVLTLLVIAGGCTVRKSSLNVIYHRTYAPEKGVYAELGNYLFGPSVVRTGLVKHSRFTAVIGFGIFLPEPRRPERIPVLLVHGHGSGPRAFETLASTMDADRFEPWFGYYATGQPLLESAGMMRETVARLAREHEVDRMVVVGYSQGGLVTRASLGSWGEDLPRVPLLIELSTPWGGSEAAAFGLEKTTGVPAWKDMAPGSDFIVHLFDDPLPDGTELHISYGTGGTNDRFPGENDDVIGKPSLTRDEAIAEATSVVQFDRAVHSGMVLDPEPLERFNELLRSLHMSP